MNEKKPPTPRGERHRLSRFPGRRRFVHGRSAKGGAFAQRKPTICHSLPVGLRGSARHELCLLLHEYLLHWSPCLTQRRAPMRQLLLALLACIALPPAVCAQADAVARLEIFPAARTLHGPTKTQQLAVIAAFKNGSKRDVTHLAQFQSSDNEIATVSAKGLVRFWQPGEIAVLCRYHTLASVQLRFVEPKPGFLWTKPPENNLVDHLIFEKLKDLSLLPSELCSDVVFLRRAYLDLCGHLPTPPETKRFLEDPRADKRTRLIDELLARPQHAELWAHHCADMLHLRSSRSTILG